MGDVIAFVELMGNFNSLRETVELLKGQEHCTSVLAVTGPYDYLVEVRCQSIWQLTKVLDQLTNFPWVVRSRSSVVKEVVQEPSSFAFVEPSEEEEKSLLRTRLMAFVAINVRTGMTKPLISRLRKVPEVERVYAVTGEHDLVAAVTCDSMQAFAELLDRVHEYEYVKGTSTAFVVRVGRMMRRSDAGPAPQG
jgi:DNA-binding Lrp family transcriptional regulator